MDVNGVIFSEESFGCLSTWQDEDSMAGFYIRQLEELSNWILDNLDSLPGDLDILQTLVLLRDIKKDITTIIKPSLGGINHNNKNNITHNEL